MFYFFPLAPTTLNIDGASARNGPHSSKCGWKTEAPVDDEDRASGIELIVRSCHRQR